MSDANAGPVTEGFGDPEHANPPKKPVPAPSPFTPLVLVLGFVCMGLLIAVVTMSALISADDGVGGYTTVVCPDGSTAGPIASTPEAAAATAAGTPPASAVVTASPPPATGAPPSSINDCPTETLYWEYPADVFDGYKGCVSAVGMQPCAQDGFEQIGALANTKPVTYNPTTKACEATEYTPETMTYWILWGSPMDNVEMSKRTGSMPTISFPFDRAPYPSYRWGEHGDDSLSSMAKQKEFLLYLNAFTQTELDAFDVGVTEGAEAGMVLMWGAMALGIAQTTCNRDIYAIVEVPCYGYSNSAAAGYANDYASSFYNGTECECFATDTCKDPIVKITSVGYAPGSDFPVRRGGDGVDYVATSSSPASPWFESLVFPENPSGTIKTVMLSNPDRRVCDGVYLYPMYFGPSWEVADSRPDCESWSFSITKSYSASVRAGHIMYKKTGPNHANYENLLEDMHSMPNGLLSEWSWRGQVQLHDMMMAKPYTDPTSWIGAYTGLMKDKWDYVIEGFANCPPIEILNDYAGAYVWLKKKPDYMGLETGFITTLFEETLGIKTTTYNWGFRGADPADMYGEGYTVTDFTRVHLYRDINVYKELNRRAKLMCSGQQVADHLMTYAEWKVAHTPADGGTRHLLAVHEHDETHEDTRRRLREAVPRLTEKQLEFHTKNHQANIDINKNIEKHCAKDQFSTSCLMKYTGGKYADTRDVDTKKLL
jgi:hypothetical protein